MKRKYIISIIIIVLLPIWMFFGWYVQSKKKLVIAIIDKTVLNTNAQEHSSFTWILRHEKYTKNNTALYQLDRDYYGFFPQDSEKFRIKGLERFTNEQLEQLSNDADLAYITDAYGMYKNEWFKKGSPVERSGILYGGLSEQDISFLECMKKKHKLIITEFNTMGSPTPLHIRNKFESIFQLRWTGWIGRYFESFDTTINAELPQWLIHNYKAQHNNQWPFTKAGVAFVHDDDKIVIIEEGKHLLHALPHIVTKTNIANSYGLPQNINYSFWFDVTQADTSNTIAAQFVIDVNEEGKKELALNNIPTHFPAVQFHNKKDYQFYYFSADFADNPITLKTSYFTGIQWFKWLFYSHTDNSDRRYFFWAYYRPFITKILHDYYQQLHS